MLCQNMQMHHWKQVSPTSEFSELVIQNEQCEQKFCLQIVMLSEREVNSTASTSDYFTNRFISSIF